MDGMGLWWAILSIGVLLVVVLALALAVQSLRAHELEETLSRYTNAWEHVRADLKTQTEEISRLQSALRAERAHVAQLQRKLLLLQLMLDERIEAQALQAAGA